MAIVFHFLGEEEKLFIQLPIAKLQCFYAKQQKAHSSMPGRHGEFLKHIYLMPVRSQAIVYKARVLTCLPFIKEDHMEICGYSF